MIVEGAIAAALDQAVPAVDLEKEIAKTARKAVEAPVSPGVEQSAEEPQFQFGGQAHARVAFSDGDVSLRVRGRGAIQNDDVALLALYDFDPTQPHNGFGRVRALGKKKLGKTFGLNLGFATNITPGNVNVAAEAVFGYNTSFARGYVAYNDVIIGGSDKYLFTEHFLQLHKIRRELGSMIIFAKYDVGKKGIVGSEVIWRFNGDDKPGWMVRCENWHDKSRNFQVGYNTNVNAIKKWYKKHRVQHRGNP